MTEIKGPLTVRFVARSWFMGWPMLWSGWRAERCEAAAMGHWHAAALRADRVRDLGVERGILR